MSLRLKVRIRAVADAALQHLHRLPAVGAPWEPSNEHGSAVVTPAIDADKLGSVVVTPAIDAGKLGSVVVTPAVGDDLSSAVTPTIDAVLVETGLELHAAPPCMKKPCSTTNSLGKEPGFQQFPSGYSKTPEAVHSEAVDISLLREQSAMRKRAVEQFKMQRTKSQKKLTAGMTKLEALYYEQKHAA